MPVISSHHMSLIRPTAELPDPDEICGLDGYSGADIKGFTAVVTDYPYQRQIETGQEQIVTKEDVVQALSRVKPSVNDKMLARYEQYRRDRGEGP